MVQCRALLALLVLAVAACSTPRPVLYPNLRYAEAGEAGAQADIDECVALAKEFEANPPSQPGEGVTTDVLEGATIGAATGVAVGAVVGNAGRGAGAGAAGGAAGSLVRAIFRGARERNDETTFHVFVERCLEERGYELLGWT